MIQKPNLKNLPPNQFTDTFSSYLSSGQTYIDSLDNLLFNQAEALDILTHNKPAYTYTDVDVHKCFSFKEEDIYYDYHINRTPLIGYYVNYTVENDTFNLLGYAGLCWNVSSFNASRIILDTYLPKYNAVTVDTELMLYGRKAYIDLLNRATSLNNQLEVKILVSNGDEIDINNTTYFRQNIRKMFSYKLKIYSAHCYQPKFLEQ